MLVLVLVLVLQKCYAMRAANMQPAADAAILLLCILARRDLVVGRGGAQADPGDRPLCRAQHAHLKN